MLFSSNVFLFAFLPIALIGYQLLSRFGRPAMMGWLAVISLYFYSALYPPYLILLLASILVNFGLSFLIQQGRGEKTRSLWLVLAIVANLGLLAYYKYLFPLLNFFHRHGPLPHSFLELVLPLGISFFTFTQIAHHIDLRQDIAKRQDLLSYTVFVAFFPHLIAGPIIHPRELMPQFERGRIHAIRADDFALGCSWFVMGLAKKVLLADRIAPLADALYANPHAAGLATSWLGVLAYSAQLYFDFSGYSDMAVALAKMFSIDFPVNFNSPFKAVCIIDFWQRWHMTLSRYLQEYLYSPILSWVNGRRIDAGKKANRKAAATPEGFVNMVAFPTLTTMAIAGIWHGANLTFLVFGLLHGVYLSINHGWRLWTPKGSPLHQKLPRVASVLITFMAVVVGQIFFRAGSVRDGCYVIGSMLGLHHGPSFADFPGLADIPTISKFEMSLQGTLLALFVCYFICWAMPNTQEILGELPKDQKRMASLLPRLQWRLSAGWSVGLAALLTFSLLMLDSGAKFLYFQF